MFNYFTLANKLSQLVHSIGNLGQTIVLKFLFSYHTVYFSETKCQNEHYAKISWWVLWRPAPRTSQRW